VDISAATANWGVNLANLTLSNSAVSTVTFLLDPVGASPTYNPYNVFQVNGSNVTPRWVNGVQPPIVAGYINTLTYSLLNNGGNIVVLASSSNYS
jgi:hypothetical protein